MTTTPTPTRALPWRERRFAAMGSTAHLVALGDAEAALDWGVEEVGRLEQLWSRFLPGSDVARLNGGGGRPVAVAPETATLVAEACRLWTDTGGAFDPTVLRALEACGYDESFERVRARAGTETRATPRPAPGCGRIRVLDDHTVALPPGVGLDLGGIGKGAAADLVATGMVARGARGACVALGGDVRVTGAGPDGGPWPVPVEHPLDETRDLFVVALTDGAVVTSTTRFRRWYQDGVLRHHLVDPRTGLPAARGVVAVVATGASAARAEALAKAALVLGADDGRTLLERAGVTAWLVTDDGLTSMVDSAPASGPPGTPALRLVR